MCFWILRNYAGFQIPGTNNLVVLVQFRMRTRLDDLTIPSLVTGVYNPWPHNTLMTNDTRTRSRDRRLGPLRLLFTPRIFISEEPKAGV